ncbi:hypothetical protein P8452_61591 [Trifolium repens]|nr:hypothetical protein P8452_61591 [Trifolium repens]
MCGEMAETSRHLFLHCYFAAAVWYHLNRWLGVRVVLPPEVMLSYGQLVGSGGYKKIRKRLSIVWLAFVWVIWRVRNNQVFDNVDGTVENTMDKIQCLSWQVVFEQDCERLEFIIRMSLESGRLYASLTLRRVVFYLPLRCGAATLLVCLPFGLLYWSVPYVLVIRNWQLCVIISAVWAVFVLPFSLFYCF